MVFLPKEKEAGGEILGLADNELIDFLWGEKGEASYFVGVGGEGARVGSAVEPDEFVIGIGAGGDVVKASESKAGGGGDTDLFGNFAMHGGVVIFPCVDMATDARGPATGFAVFL